MDEDWNELWCFEDVGAIQTAVVQKLQNYGIKVPRRAESEPRSSSQRGKGSGGAAAAFFGVALESSQQPSVIYRHGEHDNFKLPRFLVEAVQFLEHHTTMHGLFRKAGSVARQKTLKSSLDSGNSSIPEDANVHDVAGLLKQYFRELPEPLITSRLFPVFDASFSLPRPDDRRRCVLMACLLLPRVHLQCLCVLMKLLHSVSEMSTESLMDASNLAIVLAPNIMRPNIDIKKVVAPGNPIKNQTGIAQLLIESAPLVGCVPSSVYAPKPPKVVETVPLAEYKQVKVQNSSLTPKPLNSMESERKIHNPVQNSVREERKVQNSVVVDGQTQKSEVEIQNFVNSKANSVQSPATGNGLKVERPTVQAQQNVVKEKKGKEREKVQISEEGKLRTTVKPSVVEERNHFVRNHRIETVNSVKRGEGHRTAAENETEGERKTPPASLQVKAKEQENILQGPLLYAGIGLLVLVVAFLISKVVYV